MASYHIELRTQDRIWETLDAQSDDPELLRLEMAKFVGELLTDHAGRIWEDREWRVDVPDRSGLILYVLHICATDSPAMNAPSR